MDTLTKNILQKLKLAISLEFLNPNNTEYEKRIYREISTAKSPGMLLEAIKKLSPEEIERLKKKLEPDVQIIYKTKEKFDKKRAIPNTFSLNFSEN